MALHRGNDFVEFLVRTSKDTVGEFGIAVRSGLENPDYRSVKTLLLPIDGTFQSRLMNSPTVSRKPSLSTIVGTFLILLANSFFFLVVGDPTSSSLLSLFGKFFYK